MGMNGCVAVLLSTFNGLAFFDEQLKSVDEQILPEGWKVKLIVRDDGSTDPQFRAHLMDLRNRRTDIDIIFGSNLGPAQSNFALLKSIEYSALVALCDQDDYWLPNKIAAAIKKLEGSNRPSIYFSRLLLCDGDLKPESLSFLPSNLPPSNAFSENYITGCTLVMNWDAVEVLRKLGFPNKVVMHDAWINLVMSFLGVRYIDQVPHILYRRHGGNVVGLRTSQFVGLYNRFSRSFSRKGEYIGFHHQAKEFLARTGSVRSADLAMVEEFVSSRGSVIDRIKLIVRRRYYRLRWLEDFVFQVRFLFGRY